MHITDTPLEGLKIITLKMHGDARGFFVERFNRDAFAAAGLPTEFVQDNHSRSAPNIVRGLHFQYDKPQGKLVGCLRGKILDVAVDARSHSPTFGKHFSVELSDENATLLWVPAGFAHGFSVLGDGVADVFYKVTAMYNPAGEDGFKFDDPELAIDWRVNEPQVSARDAAAQSFADYKKNPRF